MASFAKDIVPMFTSAQIICMSNQGVFLDDYSYMSDRASDATYADHAAARHVYARLLGTTEGRRMPPGGPFWSPDMLERFQAWIENGFAP
jgi:hypothetical protein